MLKPPLLQGWRRFLQAIQLPSQCHICHAWPAQPLCQACLNQFAPSQTRCISCAMPLPAGQRRCGACLQQPPPLDLCLAAVAYAYPWSGLIGQYKFHAEPGLVRAFAAVLRALPAVQKALADADWLLPMPLSNQRLQTRGYNQALLLARQLKASKTRHDLLLRIQDTTPQHLIKRAQRLKALDHAFAVPPALAPLLHGRRLVLLDDVMTTGASMFTAAKALKAAGAAEVTGLVLARTH